VHARVATFQGDPADIDALISRVGGDIEAGNIPEGLEGAKMLMLVDRETGNVRGITLFESEDAMRKGDAALNAMNPPGGQRTSVEYYEVPVETIS